MTHAEYMRAWTRRRRAVGGCRACLRRAEPGRARCRAHRVATRHATAARREKARAIGWSEPPTAQERAAFMQRVRVLPSGCWEWAGPRFASGYGCASFRARSSRAHRVAWFLFIGEIPDGQHVMHRCDNPICVNYRDHLALGTHQANMRDMARKGRANIAPAQAARLTRKVS